MLASTPTPPSTGSESAAISQAAGEELQNQDAAQAEADAMAAQGAPGPQGAPPPPASPAPGGQSSDGPPKVASLPEGLVGAGLGGLAAGTASLLSKGMELPKIDSALQHLQTKQENGDGGFLTALGIAQLKGRRHMAELAEEFPKSTAAVTAMSGAMAGAGLERAVRNLAKPLPLHLIHKAR